MTRLSLCTCGAHLSVIETYYCIGYLWVIKIKLMLTQNDLFIMLAIKPTAIKREMHLACFDFSKTFADSFACLIIFD